MEADPTLEIDVNRELSVSDLTISDINAEIGIELPKMWIERFKSKAEFKRVNKSSAEATDEPENTTPSTGGNTTGGGGNTSSGNNTGGNTGGGNNEPIGD